MTHLAQLADEVHVHERTLRRAINEGTVRATRPSPRTLELSLAERQYIRRSWRLLSALRAGLRTEHNVRLAVMFGSAARGSDTADSDVDLLVELLDPGLERIVDLSARLTALTGRPIDVVRLNDAETDPLFLANVVTGGRVLVDRDRQWPRLVGHAAELRRLGARHQARRVDNALAEIDRLPTRR